MPSDAGAWPGSKGGRYCWRTVHDGMRGVSMQAAVWVRQAAAAAGAFFGTTAPGPFATMGVPGKAPATAAALATAAAARATAAAAHAIAAAANARCSGGAKLEEEEFEEDAFGVDATGRHSSVSLLVTKMNRRTSGIDMVGSATADEAETTTDEPEPIPSSSSSSSMPTSPRTSEGRRGLGSSTKRVSLSLIGISGASSTDDHESYISLSDSDTKKGTSPSGLTAAIREESEPAVQPVPAQDKAPMAAAALATMPITGADASGPRRRTRPISASFAAVDADSVPAWVTEAAERRRRRERQNSVGEGDLAGTAATPVNAAESAAVSLSSATKTASAAVSSGQRSDAPTKRLSVNTPTIGERTRAVTMDSIPEWKRALQAKRLAAQLKAQEVRLRL